MKKLALSVAILIAWTLCGNAQETSYRIVTDNYSTLQVAFTVGDVNVGKTVIDGQTFSTIAIDGCQQSLDNYGSPALPVFSRLIEVPVGAEFEVTVGDAEYDTIAPLDYQLVPVQLPRRKSDTTAQPPCHSHRQLPWRR